MSVGFRQLVGGATCFLGAGLLIASLVLLASSRRQKPSFLPESRDALVLTTGPLSVEISDRDLGFYLVPVSVLLVGVGVFLIKRHQPSRH
jgi:hypothetical protein